MSNKSETMQPAKEALDEIGASFADVADVAAELWVNVQPAFLQFAETLWLLLQHAGQEAGKTLAIYYGNRRAEDVTELDT